MIYKIGDFIHYEFEETKDYSIITKNYENKEGEQVYGTVIEALSEFSEKTVGISYSMMPNYVKLITDEQLISRLNKLMVFK